MGLLMRNVTIHGWVRASLCMQASYTTTPLAAGHPRAVVRRRRIPKAAQV
jgi:hypothetical protein